MRLKIGFGVLLLVGCWLLLASRRSYSPGPLMKGHSVNGHQAMGHQAFASNCANCHQPWGPVEISTLGCIDCHGDITANPHFEQHLIPSSQHDYSVLDKNEAAEYWRLSASKVPAEKALRLAMWPRVIEPMPLTIGKQSQEVLTCLSCHTDHVRSPGLVGGRENCTSCHDHPSIDGVTKHAQVEWRASTSKFPRGFVHSKELADLQKRDPLIQRLPCKGCHHLDASPDAENFVLIREANAASPPAEPDEYAKLWDAHPPPGGGNQRPMFSSFQHINAVFKHSQAHHTYDCAVCHNSVEKSVKPADDPVRQVAVCFSCHAKSLSAAQTVTVADTAQVSHLTIAAVAYADAQIGAPKKATQEKAKFKTCTECHDFHVHGTRPVHDFTHKPRTARTQPIPLRGGWLPEKALAALGGIFGILLFVGWMTKPEHEHLQPSRGALVPARNSNYETNVPGLFIAGEATGIPAINDAMRSGREAAMAIAEARKSAAEAESPGVKAADPKAAGSPDAASAGPPSPYDVIVVGCGPAGMGAATYLRKNSSLNYLVLEKLSVASTIQAYPRDKVVHATPLQIDDYDDKLFLEGDDAKEKLVEHWKKIVEVTGLKVNEHEEVTDIRKKGDTFEVVTTKASHLCHTVLLAPGTRSSPHHLRMKGETPDRVFYDCQDASQFQGKRILVVGGGNAGHEVVIALVDPQLGNTVTFSYRSLQGVTVENRQHITALVRQGRLTEMPSTRLDEIRPHSVLLSPLDPPPEDLSLRQWMVREGARIFTALYAKLGGRSAEAKGPEAKPAISHVEIPNDIIFAMIGAGPPVEFFAKVGIEMEIKGR